LFVRSGTVARVPYWEADMIGYDSGRRLRTSAIFTRSEPYAVFGQTMAYERPLYFHTDSLVDDDDLVHAWTLPKPTSIHGIKSCMYYLMIIYYYCCCYYLLFAVEQLIFAVTWAD